MKSLLKMESLKTMSETIKICEMIIEHQDHYRDERVFEARALINNYLNY